MLINKRHENGRHPLAVLQDRDIFYGLNKPLHYWDLFRYKAEYKWIFLIKIPFMELFLFEEASFCGKDIYLVLKDGF